MEQANAGGVRSSWKDSFVADLSKQVDSQLHKAPLLALRGQARQISAPYWQRFLNSEHVLRRTIPVLIVLLLVLVAGARTGSLLTEADRIESASKVETAMLADLVSLKLQSNPSLDTTLVSPTLASVFLEDALPKSMLKSGQAVSLLDSNRKIVVKFPEQQTNVEISLTELIEKGFRNSTDRTQNVLVAGGERVYAAYRQIDLGNGTFAGLLVTQLESVAFLNWRQQVKLSITLLLAIGSVLLVILYAYFAQGARAREADNLFMETNARFDTALARGHCGLWDWDLSRGRIVWSRSMYQMLGMEPTDNVLGFGDLSPLLHPADQDMMSLANAAFESDQRQIDHRFRIMHSSGSWVWMRIRAELVRYKGADPHLIGIAVDITEQEALKQQNKNADIRLRDAIENISEAFVLWDSKKRLVMCNSKYQQLYKLSADAVKSGSHHEEVMAKSRKPRARHQIKTDKRHQNGTQTFEAQIEDGRWLQISERRTQDGGFVSVGTDITQIKRNQEKLVESEQKQMATIADLRKTQQELERQAQKLVEFADNLNEQKKRADAGNQAKSEFLANISHELRTPLNAIIGFSDIMKSNMFGPLGSEKYLEYAHDIHHSGGFLLGVINDVLDMSKIEAGRFQLNPESVKLDELLRETLRIIQIQADEAKINVSHKIPKALELEADRRAVKQILLNLISNAVKFTPEGGKIDITAKALKSSVKIVIRDNGVGIAPEALERLGQPFEQVQDQFTKDHKGSGLGLAIARSLSILHGGSLEISSELGEGTTISIQLPFQCDVALPTETEETQQAA